MGKKSKKNKPVAKTQDDSAMPRNIRRETLEACNILLDKCSKNIGGQSAGEEWADFIEIYTIVTKLRNLQQSSITRTKSRSENFIEFFKWLEQNDVNTQNVAIESFPIGGYGLKATRNIQDHELFLTIPRCVMMSTDTARSSPLKSLIEEDRILQAMPNIVLALHVLCEVGTIDSFWTPYLNILPSSYSTPLYFNTEEIQLLKGSPAFSDVLNQFRNITRQYAYFYKLFQTSEQAGRLPQILKDLCFDDYKWAVSSVMTRQNQIPSNNGERMMNALIPLWDMCNHTNGQITTDYNLEKDQSECYSLGHIQQDDQVFIFYGDRSNADFLVHSGFVYPSNQCDRLSVKMGISKNDVLYGMKAEVLARLSLLPSRTFSLRCSQFPVDSDTLAYLRVFSMSKEDLENVLKNQPSLRGLRDFGVVFSIENEVKAWTFISTRAQLLLRSYPNDTSMDEQLLSGNTLNDFARMCVQLRLAEKRILYNTCQYAQAQAEQAKSPQTNPGVGAGDMPHEDLQITELEEEAIVDDKPTPATGDMSAISEEQEGSEDKMVPTKTGSDVENVHGETSLVQIVHT